MKQMDEITTIEELLDIITEYREQNQLDKQDNIFELIKAINVEAGELLELITFSAEFEDKLYKTLIKQELANVLIYTLALAEYMCLDIEDLIRQKIEYNIQRNRKIVKIFSYYE